MNLTFEGFLKGYCRELSGQQSLSFRKLVEQATTDAPRVAEALFLLALAQSWRTSAWGAVVWLAPTGTK